MRATGAFTYTSSGNYNVQTYVSDQFYTHLVCQLYLYSFIRHRTNSRIDLRSEGMSWPVASTSSGPALPIDLQFNHVASVEIVSLSVLSFHTGESGEVDKLIS